MIQSLRAKRKLFFVIGLTAAVLLSLPFEAAAQAVNLIQNPSLETAGTTGVPANWSNVSWGTPTPTFAYPVAGNGSAKAASITYAANSTGDARWSHTPVTVTPGTTYTYSSWYKSTVATEVDIEFTSSTGVVSYGWVADVPSSANAWKQVTGVIAVPAGVTKMVVYHLIDKAGTLVIDDVSLTGGTTPPPVNTPTLTLTGTPSTVTAGQSAALAWSATNVTGCTASNGWAGAKALSGTQGVTPTATTTYSLDCVGTGGTIHKDVTIGVLPATPVPGTPTLTFSASAASVTAGGQVTLTWSSTNTTSCTASNGWSGVKTLAGSQVLTPSVTTTYVLTCGRVGGTVSKQVVVSVTPVTPPPSVQGMVSFSFDDSWISQYTNVLPILQSAGYKGTFYLTTQPIQEVWDGFMTTTQVRNIATKGHEIAGHTVTHADLATLSQSGVNTEIKNSKSYLENLTGQSVTSLAYPYGSTNASVKTLSQQAGYTSARGVDDESQNTKTSDKYDLKSSCIESNVSLATVKSMIDSAKANNRWFILCFHEVKTGGDQYAVTPAFFQQVVDYVKSSGIKVVTVKEGRAWMNN